MKTNLSSCCNAEVKTVVTRHWCLKCGSRCDLASPEVIEKLLEYTGGNNVVLGEINKEEVIEKLPSERIKEIYANKTKFFVNNDVDDLRMQTEKYLDSILEYLDEEFNKNNK